MAMHMHAVHTVGVNWTSMAIIFSAIGANILVSLVSIQQLRRKLNGHLEKHFQRRPADTDKE